MEGKRVGGIVRIQVRLFLPTRWYILGIEKEREEGVPREISETRLYTVLAIEREQFASIVSVARSGAINRR